MKGNARQGGGASMGHTMRKAVFAWGLSALMAVLLTAGCAHQQTAPAQGGPTDMQKLVLQVVKDPERAGKINVLLQQLDAQLKSRRQLSNIERQELLRLNAEYSSTPEQFQALIESSRESRMKSRALILDTYSQVKALTTPQEWEAISSAEIREAEALQKDASKKAE